MFHSADKSVSIHRGRKILAALLVFILWTTFLFPAFAIRFKNILRDPVEQNKLFTKKLPRRSYRAAVLIFSSCLLWLTDQQ